MNALLVGCGSKFGLKLLQDLLDKGWQVYTIQSSEIDHRDNLYRLTIDWTNLNQATVESFLRKLPKLDLIFFNQNGSALNENNFDSMNKLELLKLEKNWSQCYFNSCILPFHILHNVKTEVDSRIIWMLSSYIYNHNNIQYADYTGNKFQNYMIMRNFSKTKKSCYFGLNPENLYTNQKFDKLLFLLENYNSENNGKVLYFDGTEDKNFDKFNFTL